MQAEWSTQIIILSLFLKSNFTLYKLIRQENDQLWEKCEKDQIGFVSNDNIIMRFLWEMMLIQLTMLRLCL